MNYMKMIAFHALYCHLLRLFSWHCWSIFRIRDFWAVNLFWRFNMLSNQYHSPTCTHTVKNTSNGTQTQLNTHIYIYTHTKKIRRYYVVREDTAYLSIIYKHSISTPHPVNRCIHLFFSRCLTDSAHRFICMKTTLENDNTKSFGTGL